MSLPEFLNPYERMLEIRLLSRDTKIPSNNSLLRCFQYLCPEHVAYGRFCWNNECGNSRFSYLLPGDDETYEARACIFEPVDKMEITELSGELRYALRSFFSAHPSPKDARTGEEDSVPPPIVFRNP